MAGGPDNPLGARALYLWQGNKDTLYRIHGTNEPWTIGHNVSSGCIRMVNDDVVDLYERSTRRHQGRGADIRCRLADRRRQCPGSGRVAVAFHAEPSGCRAPSHQAGSAPPDGRWHATWSDAFPTSFPSPRRRLSGRACRTRGRSSARQFRRCSGSSGVRRVPAVFRRATACCARKSSRAGYATRSIRSAPG